MEQTNRSRQAPANFITEDKLRNSKTTEVQPTITEYVYLQQLLRSIIKDI